MKKDLEEFIHLEIVEQLSNNACSPEHSRLSSAPLKNPRESASRAQKPGKCGCSLTTLRFSSSLCVLSALSTLSFFPSLSKSDDAPYFLLDFSPNTNVTQRHILRTAVFIAFLGLFLLFTLKFSKPVWIYASGQQWITVFSGETTNK